MRAGGLIFAAAALGLSGCVTLENDGNSLSSSEQAASSASVETLPSAELAALIAEGKVVLIDVRTPGEFESGSLAGALNAPMQTFDPAAMPRDPTRETILYCASSGRSKRAADLLADQWNTKVRHLEGGIRAWKAADQAVVEPGKAP